MSYGRDAAQPPRDSLLGANAVNQSIHGLPSEILAHVFSYLRVSEVEDYDDSNLMAATHVCRGWRAVALDNAALWATIHVTNIYKALTFVARSKGALLDIRITVPDAVLAGVFALTLVDVIDRLRSLVVESNVAGAWQVLSRLVGRPAPHLQTLHIFVGSVVRPIERCFDVLRVAGEASTQSSTPSLRVLRVDPAWIPWDSGLYQNLTVLELKYPHQAMRTSCPSQRRLLEILRQCPGLQSLTLELRAIMAPEAPRGDPAWTIPLPSLSTLAVRGPPPTSIADLLSHLVLPPSTRYDIRTIEDIMTHDTQTYYDVFPKNRDGHPGLKEFTGVELRSEDTGNLIIFRLFSSPSIAEADAVVTLSVGICCLEYAAQSVPAMVLESAETFMFRGSDIGEDDPIESWSAIFDLAPRLRVLGLANPGSDLLCALRDLTHPLPRAGQSTPALRCPELESLEFADLSLYEAEKQAMLDFVQGRAKAGLAVKRMKFVNVIGLSTDLLESLWDMGVIVDGLALATSV